MKPIAIIIPTLKQSRGASIGQLAVATAGPGVKASVIVSPDPNRTGFTRTVNRGIHKAPANADICLLNDDILQFQYDWLGTLQRALYRNPKFGIVAPSGGSATKPMCNGRPGDQGLKKVSQAPFWCVLIRRAVIDQCGLLDEGFIHYASDNWFCVVVRRKGWQIVWVKDVFLHHKKHGSGRQNKWKSHDHALLRRKMRK